MFFSELLIFIRKFYLNSKFFYVSHTLVDKGLMEKSSIITFSELIILIYKNKQRKISIYF